MARTNKTPNLTEKLAAALLELLERRGDPIERDIAKQMTAAQICSLFEYDHAVTDAVGGTNHPTNLTPRLIMAHRDKTAKFDVPQIYKGRRLSAKEAEFRARVLAKGETIGAMKDREALTRRRSAWPKGRKLESRNNLRKENRK